MLLTIYVKNANQKWLAKLEGKWRNELFLSRNVLERKERGPKEVRYMTLVVF
jgi:hypothetical protein